MRFDPQRSEAIAVLRTDCPRTAPRSICLDRRILSKNGLGFWHCTNVSELGPCSAISYLLPSQR